jgi:hypothetical protein
MTDTNNVLGLKDRRRFTNQLPLKTGRSGNILLDKVDFKHKLVRRDIVGHFIVMKGEIYQEKIAIINLYVLTDGAPNFTKHTLMDLKSQINSNIAVVGDFNSPLSPIDRSFRQKK